MLSHLGETAFICPGGLYVNTALMQHSLLLLWRHWRTVYYPTDDVSSPMKVKECCFTKFGVNPEKMHDRFCSCWKFDEGFCSCWKFLDIFCSCWKFHVQSLEQEVQRCLLRTLFGYLTGIKGEFCVLLKKLLGVYFASKEKAAISIYFFAFVEPKVMNRNPWSPSTKMIPKQTIT